MLFHQLNCLPQTYPADEVYDKQDHSTLSVTYGRTVAFRVVFRDVNGSIGEFPELNIAAIDTTTNTSLPVAIDFGSGRIVTFTCVIVDSLC